MSYLLKYIQPNLRLEHFVTDAIKDNWNVFVSDIKIGMLHDCDGIGGHLGSFTDMGLTVPNLDETPLFDYVCEMAKHDLVERILLEK